MALKDLCNSGRVERIRIAPLCRPTAGLDRALVRAQTPARVLSQASSIELVVDRETEAIREAIRLVRHTDDGHELTKHRVRHAGLARERGGLDASLQTDMFEHGTFIQISST